jgi:hypothetical protein
MEAKFITANDEPNAGVWMGGSMAPIEPRKDIPHTELKIGTKYNIQISDINSGAQFTATLLKIISNGFEFDNGVHAFGDDFCVEFFYPTD